jgi:hypothetical protein
MKKLFKCNEGGVAEWCVAESDLQAYDFMKDLWGASTMQEYVDEYLDDNMTFEDFLNDFFVEEDVNKNFTISDAGVNGEPVTKKVSEWIEGEEAPSYFCCENY